MPGNDFLKNDDPSDYLNSEFRSVETEEEAQPSEKLPISEELPISEYQKEIEEVIQNNDISIIVGETGSGKTTQIPLMLRGVLEENDKVAITQPRRVAARSVSKYVARQVGCEIGQEVGYHIRFDDQTTKGTRINFVTDGLLVRQMQSDPLLQEYSAIMVDEAHERSLNIDFTLGLLKDAQENRQQVGLPPLKIVVSSATLEKDKFLDYFDNPPMVEVPGRLHPIDTHYLESTLWNYDYTRGAADKVEEIVNEGKPGDILIFMPGQKEINDTIKEIEGLEKNDLTVLPLYGQLSPEDQDKIFEEAPGRKVVVATNIAETSVTVPGIRHVIDSGVIKQIEFNPKSGIERLATVEHAQSGCIQRAGRAGRIAPGECWRLYSEDNFKDRQEHQKPEIQRSNLANVVLTMKQMGIDNIESFDFIDQPETDLINQAINTLKILGALDNEENITEDGELMAQLPLEPRIGRMILEAERHNCVETVCTIAAFLSARNVFNRPKGKENEADLAHKQFQVEGSDFLTQYKIWKFYEHHNYSDRWAHENFLNSKALNEIKSIRYQLFEALGRNRIRVSENMDKEAIAKSVAAGLVEDLMVYDGYHTYRRETDLQGNFYVHPSSVNFKEPHSKIIVPAQIMETSRVYARTTQEVKPKWLPEIAPTLIEATDQSYYDTTEDKPVKCTEIILKNTESSYITREEPTKEEATTIIARAMAKGKIKVPGHEENLAEAKRLRKLWVKAQGEI